MTWTTLQNFTSKIPGEEYLEQNLSTELAMQFTSNLSKFPDKNVHGHKIQRSKNEISKSPKNIILFKIILYFKARNKSKIISANQGSQNPLTNESYSLNMYKMSYSVQVNLYKKILFYPSFSHCN